MYALLRPLLFALPPGEAHTWGMGALMALEQLDLLRDVIQARLAPPPSLATLRLGLRFPSPIGLAGGFDKDARAPKALAALGFGFLELGTVTAQPQEPNPPPNLFRLPADRALVNRLGFPNEGAKAVARRFARDVGRGGARVPVGFSIGKSRAVPIDDLDAVVTDYLTSFRAVRPVSDFVVVNVSSPNTKGLRALQGVGLAGALLRAIVGENERHPDKVPLLLKVSPDLSDAELALLLDVVADVKLDGVIATNTTTSRDGLATRPETVKDIGPGGLSGPPLRRRVLEVVPRIRSRLGPDATVIAVGGVTGSGDVARCIAAGADLVQLYTSFIYEGPGLPSRLARELAEQRARGASRLA